MYQPKGCDGSLTVKKRPVLTAGERFRDSISTDFEAPDAAETVLLDRVCALLDQIETMEARVTADGPTVVGGNGQLCAHPLLASIRQHSEVVGRLVGRLGVEDESQGMRSARRAANARWSK